MSDDCVEGGEIGCEQVLADVWLFLDDEMDVDRRAVVQRHLDDCSPCLAETGLDRKLKVLLRNKCGGDVAPDSLRARLVASMSKVSVHQGGGVTTVTQTVVVTEIQ